MNVRCLFGGYGFDAFILINMQIVLGLWLN
jgi:hypothetical protein